MKTLLVTVAGFSLLAFAACGDGDGDSGPDGGTGSPASPASGSATPTAEQLEELMKTEVPGFVRSDSRVAAGSGMVLYTSVTRTAGGANALVNVRLAACDPFLCGSLDPKDYASADAQKNLKSLLSQVHIESPALVWDFGRTELASGRTGLHTYALSYVETKDASGGVSRASANSFRAWYHNGGLHIMLEVFARGGDSAQSADDLKRRMSRAEAEEAAKHVFAAFAPAFEK